ncbi:MAG: hypothetical protein JSU68_14275 [Phycisphaerales bacterium]|nr:MAG: hypothetical protein JSU68_14275 [Phycisphaerales bacterium]
MRRFICSAIAIMALAIQAPAAEVTYDVRPGDGLSSPVQVAPGGTVPYEVTIEVSSGDNDGLLLFIFDLLTDLGVPQSTDTITFDPLIASLFNFGGFMQYGTAVDDDITDIGGTQGFGLGGETPGIGHGSPQLLIRGELQTPTNQLGDFNVTIGANTKTQLIAPGGGIIDDPAITTNLGPGFVIQVLADSDQDGTPDINDNCPDDANPGQDDSDGDQVGDACDACPDDPDKIGKGACGCGTADTDTDGDATPDCIDPTPQGGVTPSGPPSNGDQPPVVAPPGCGAGVGMANLVGFGALCLVGLVGLRRGRWY